MTKPLESRVALVTGASGGIGEASARMLADRGAKVVLAARSADRIREIAEEIRSSGGEAAAVPCDVSNYDQVAEAVDTALATFGGIDILVNNAGVIEPIARLDESDPDEWGKVIDINVKGVYHGMHAVLPTMLKNGSGVIINISSGAATSTLEGWSHYCTSKAAALMLTRMGHKEYGDKGIRVIGLSPGTVATNMQKEIKASGVNPVSQLEWDDHIPPEWVGEAICWLATDDAAEFDGGDVSLRDPEIRKRVGVG